MKKSASTQIIPFPLPAYLATFFASQITTKPVMTLDGSFAKPFAVKKNTEFGKYLLKKLSTTSVPVKVKQGFTFYIEVSGYQTHKSKDIVDTRSSFCEFTEESILEITKLFKAVFESHLTEHVNAYKDAILSVYPEKQRGIRNTAITNFCKKYGVLFTNKNLDAWKKMLQRDEKRLKPNKIRML